MTSLQVKQENAANKAKKLVTLVFVTIIATLVWAKFATLQEAVVGIGNVVPAQAVQTIENLDGGILQELLVKNGDLVSKGQKLMLLEDIRFSAALSESTQEQSSLNLKQIRLAAELKTVTFSDDDVVVTVQEISLDKLNSFEQQQVTYSYGAKVDQLITKLAQNKQAIAQHQQAINEQQENIKSLSKRLNLLTKEVILTEEVVDMGAVSEMELFKLQRDHAMIEGDLERAKVLSLQQQSARQQAIEERKSIGYEFLANARTEMDEVLNTQAKMRESSKALIDRVNKTQIFSPVQGTVKNIITRSVGEVIEPGQPIMEIVPLDDQLLIETKIAPQDIGFLHLGMQAMVKFTAYDFVIYGGLTGEVIYIGADAQKLEDGTTYYEVHVKTHSNTLGEKTIIPGMQTSVDILTGQKTVLNYWLKPLLRAKANAMKER
ncbi:HlyD family type I secretion periplasmic adaptor subunit [Colwellia sp. E2M01]|uniref:HlyD family type I secretion periplasmic adaptor subunit n=1 Tax=Colwellia sp. E2M01 TaxID=2841561 RepID=UPI001C085F5B|nr:HlyD family type I secretion periplasmic adaptor subunit [Colwellia sp. E2M01]MBU2871316.1 HlyD family type I secretion periplasmic adaptor subunit [Colwellia sp. E2M01]